jgi:hypothetical protein
VRVVDVIDNEEDAEIHCKVLVVDSSSLSDRDARSDVNARVLGGGVPGSRFWKCRTPRAAFGSRTRA